MQTSEWKPRIATADRYLNVQYEVMEAAINDAPISEALTRLDNLRRARVALTSLPPAEFITSHEFSESEVNDAVEFLEKRLKAEKNDELLTRWLATAQLPPDIANFERAHGLEIDPEFDIFILGGGDADALLHRLQERGYSRLLLAREFSCADDNAKIDELKFIKCLSRLSNIHDVRPNRLHYIREDICESVREAHLKSFKDRIEQYYVSRNTVVLMAPLWTPNVLKNLKRFTDDGRNLLPLVNTARGATAVVIGAGPSLDEQLPHIDAVKDRSIIICAFKALKAVTAAGIDPDIVVCLDPKQKIRHLEGVDMSRVGAFMIEAASDIELISTVSNCPLLPYVASPIPLELIRSFGDIDIPIVGTGGSAVHGALQVSILIGSRRVYFAGCDFGFPKNRLYATGAGIGDRFTVAADGQTYDRRPLDSHQRGGQLFPSPSNSGGTVGASVEMVVFKEWVEDRIRKAAREGEAQEFFNLSLDGAVIQGAPYADAIDAPEIGRSLKLQLRQGIANSPKVSTMHGRDLRRKYSARRARLKKMLKICAAIEDNKKFDEKWASDVQRVIAHAKQSLEVSTLINADLIKLGDYTKRVKNISGCEADMLTMKLLAEAKSGAEQLIQVYTDVISGDKYNT